MERTMASWSVDLETTASLRIEGDSDEIDGWDEMDNEERYEAVIEYAMEQANIGDADEGDWELAGDKPVKKNDRTWNE
jgi:hypothetical protein